MESKQRDVAIDILKGLAIIVIVMWHADSPFAQYLKSFHVAVFFMASGYVASDKYTDMWQVINTPKILKE